MGPVDGRVRLQDQAACTAFLCSSERVYTRLAECAADALRGEYTTLVDTTFARAEDRSRFRTLATSQGVSICEPRRCGDRDDNCAHQGVAGLTATRSWCRKVPTGFQPCCDKYVRTHGRKSRMLETKVGGCAGESVSSSSLDEDR